MRVYVIRHAAAAQRGAYANDNDRPLTGDGIARMKRVAKGLAALGIKPEPIYTSPLVRAKETAQIVAKALGGGAALEEADVLRPGVGASEVVTFLAKAKGDEAAIVGHEPQLGEVVALMVTGKTAPIVDMKKAAACAVDFEGAPAAGKGVIAWHAVPAVFEGLLGKKS